MMMTQVDVEKNTGNDRMALQKAIDVASMENIGTVVISGGEWYIDDTCYLHDSIRLIVDGAVLHYLGENNIIFRNSNSIKPYLNIVEVTQTNIVISGQNNAKIIGGGIMLTNISYSIIEGINFYDVKNFAIILASTLSIKVRNNAFFNCINAIALGVGTRDCFFHNLNGDVKKNFFVIGDYLYEQYRRNHRYHMILNIIIRNVKVKAETFAYMFGRDVERIAVSDIDVEVTGLAFDVRNGKHICLSGLKIKGKVLNEDVPDNAVCFVD